MWQAPCHRREAERWIKGSDQQESEKFALKAREENLRAGYYQVTYFPAKNACVDDQVTSVQFCNTLSHFTFTNHYVVFCFALLPVLRIRSSRGREILRICAARRLFPPTWSNTFNASALWTSWSEARSMGTTSISASSCGT